MGLVELQEDTEAPPPLVTGSTTPPSFSSVTCTEVKGQQSTQQVMKSKMLVVLQRPGSGPRQRYAVMMSLPLGGGLRCPVVDRHHSHMTPLTT